MTIDRELLRARIFLHSVLPLVEVMVAHDADLASLFGTGNALIQIEAAGVGAAVCVSRGKVTVQQGMHAHADVRCEFRDLAALNAFFAGQIALPRIAGGLRHPVLLLGATRLLAALRILHPQAAPADANLRALRVKLLLFLATRALAELHRGGHADMVDLVNASPERVYQWTVVEKKGSRLQAPGSRSEPESGSRMSGSELKPSIAAYLRMHEGRVKAGRGVYAGRRPFVHFVFPDVDAALAVLTASASQMAAVRSGQVVTLGSPEYSRKISRLMQSVDVLLREG